MDINVISFLVYARNSVSFNVCTHCIRCTHSSLIILLSYDCYCIVLMFKVLWATENDAHQTPQIRVCFSFFLSFSLILSLTHTIPRSFVCYTENRMTSHYSMHFAKYARRCINTRIMHANKISMHFVTHFLQFAVSVRFT